MKVPFCSLTVCPFCSGHVSPVLIVLLCFVSSVRADFFVFNGIPYVPQAKFGKNISPANTQKKAPTGPDGKFYATVSLKIHNLISVFVGIVQKDQKQSEQQLLLAICVGCLLFCSLVRAIRLHDKRHSPGGKSHGHALHQCLSAAPLPAAPNGRFSTDCVANTTKQVHR